jgi:hypothetical protein
LISAYTPIYDVSLIIPNVLITGDIVWRHSKEQHDRRLIVAVLVLAGLLICTAWVTQESAKVYGFQPLTLVLLAWGCFQIGLAWWGPSLCPHRCHRVDSRAAGSFTTRFPPPPVATRAENP